MQPSYLAVSVYLVQTHWLIVMRGITKELRRWSVFLSFHVFF